MKNVFTYIKLGQINRLYKVCNSKEFLNAQILKFTGRVIFYNNLYPYRFTFHFIK